MKWNIRNILAACRAELYILTGAVSKRQLYIQQNRYILSIYFHNPTKETFRKCIKWLKEEKYHFLTVDNLTNLNTTSFEIGKKYVIITVDDGWRENITNIVPIAIEYKTPVTIFISTEPMLQGNRFWWSYFKQAKFQGIKTNSIEKLKKIPNDDRLAQLDLVKNKILNKREAMNIEEIIEISSTPYISIGSHTVSHPILTQCSNDQLMHEVDHSKLILEQLLLKPINSFSYPNGDFSGREVEIVKNAGYKIAFGTKPFYLKMEHKDQLFTLPRFEILDNVSFSENLCRMTGVWFKYNTQNMSNE